MQTIAEITEKLTPVFRDYGVKRAVLFGSYAKNTATEKSDIDLLVDSGLHGFDFIELMEDIHVSTGLDVDVFDIMQIEKGSRSDREIQETGVTIYGKK